MKIKKYLGYFSFYLLPILLLVLSIFYTNYTSFVNWGSWAEKLLIFILFIKPIAVIIKSKKILSLMPWRKELGVAIFWLALFHSVGLIYENNFFNIEIYFTSMQLLFGTLAMIGMTILGLTSNIYSMKKLKRNWKKIQYLAYPALLLVLLHSALAEGNIIKFYVIGGLFITLKSIEFTINYRNKRRN